MVQFVDMVSKVLSRKRKSLLTIYNFSLKDITPLDTHKKKKTNECSKLNFSYLYMFGYIHDFMYSSHIEIENLIMEIITSLKNRMV